MDKPIPSLLSCVAFTGHRNYRHTKDEELYLLVEKLYEKGCRRFYDGMARGFDLAAAKVVLQFQASHPEVELVAVIPFRGMEESFNSEEQNLYRQVVERATEVVYIAERYRREVYALRNQYMVDHSSILVAWYTGQRGGTQQTVRYALNHHRTIYHLYPQPPQDGIADPELF